MDKLTRPLIDESCRLAFPEGLKELMTDISREVLRHQPLNLYEFIVNYLSALMVSREHLTIAGRLCDHVDINACYRELKEELINIGFGEEEAVKAKEIIIECFYNSGKNDTNLMKKLLNDVNMDERQQEKVKQAVHNAFRRHMTYNTTIYQSSSESELDEVDLAAKHTLNIYMKTRLSSAEYHRAADKVQASYRAYGVKRHKEDSPDEPQSSPKSDKNIRFGREVQEIAESSNAFLRFNKLSTVSSSTLAGSYLNLPRYVPYSVHTKEPLEELEEVKERENATFNYTQDEYDTTKEILDQKKISFQEPEVIEDRAVFADDESEASVEELTTNHFEKIEEFETVMNEYENDEEIDRYSLED